MSYFLMPQISGGLKTLQPHVTRTLMSLAKVSRCLGFFQDKTVLKRTLKLDHTQYDSSGIKRLLKWNFYPWTQPNRKWWIINCQKIAMVGNIFRLPCLWCSRINNIHFRYISKVLAFNEKKSLFIFSLRIDTWKLKS